MENDEQKKAAEKQQESQPNQKNKESNDDEIKYGSLKRGVSDMFRTSYRNHVELSAIADTKSNIMITVNGIIISIIIAEIADEITATPWLLMPMGAILLTCLISLVYSIRAARPRVSSENYTLEDVRKNRANILFFGNFYTMERNEFVEGIEELMSDSERLYDSMARDLHSLGQVLARKYELLKVAYDVFMYGAIVSVVCFLVVYIAMA